MQIAQVMAGYSLGRGRPAAPRHGQEGQGGDGASSRRASSRAPCKNGVKKDDAVYIFELVDKFAGYGFNKSHAAAYALVSYHTAYLKANYREEFLAASMTLDMGNTDKLAMFAAEATQRGIARAAAVRQRLGGRLPGRAAEDGEQRGAIRYSLAALKNIGAPAVETHRRRARAPTAASRTSPTSPRRCNPKALNKRGARNAGGRRRLRRARGQPRARARQRRSHAGARQPARRQRGAGHERPVRRRRRGGAGRSIMRPAQAWTPMERLQHEFEAVGFFLSGHPLDAYESVLAKLGVAATPSSRPRPSAARPRAGSPASSSRRASAARRRATSSPSPCSPTRPASSRR